MSVFYYLSGPNFFLKMEGTEPVNYKNFEMLSTLKGIKREKSCHPKQAAPILLDKLRLIFIDLTSSEGLKGGCVVLL